MTAKRDLKRRVRERQAKTGESYVTARRHVVAQVAPSPSDAATEATTDVTTEAAADVTTEATAPAPTASPSMHVVELANHDADAAKLGLRSGLRVSPRVAELGVPIVLARLHDILVNTEGDPTTALLRDVAFTGRAPRHRARRDIAELQRFFQRARAGLTGASPDGRQLAFPFAGPDGLVIVLCSIWHLQPVFVLGTLDDAALGVTAFGARDFVGIKEPVSPTLFLVFEGKRHAVASEFTIGRNKSCDLQIRDGLISRRHAFVIRRGDTYYLKDLGSAHGVIYKGMRIDNKRIDEGDVFQLGSYVLRFTYIASD